jgi:signal peptidase I
MTTPGEGRPEAVDRGADDSVITDTPGTSDTPSNGDVAGGRHAARDEPEPQRRQKKGSFWRELPFLVLIALVLALLIKTFLVQAFYIPSASMENTLQGGPPDKNYDRVLVNKLVYRLRDVHRGEIVVFKGPQSWQDQPEFVSHPPSNPVARFFLDIGSAVGVAAPSSKDFIKRVIGVEGDHVVCCDSQGRITVNGVPLNEPYIIPGAKPSDTPFDVTVPKGRLWVMGDNRSGSADSRAHMQDHDGTIPAKDVIGRAFVVVWPPGDWKTLPVPATFHQKGLAASALGAASTAAPMVLGLVGALPVTVVRRRLRSRRR